MAIVAILERGDDGAHLPDVFEGATIWAQAQAIRPLTRSQSVLFRFLGKIVQCTKRQTLITR